MTSRLFAHRDVQPQAPVESALERQQATLLELLRRKDGAATSFAELQHAGIDFPASIVSELELIGVPIERCVLDVDGTPTVGVRSTPPHQPAPPHATPVLQGPPADAPPSIGMRARDRLRRSRRPAPGTSLAALGVISAFVLGILIAGGGRASHTSVTHPRPHRLAFSATTHNGSRQASSTQAARSQPSALAPPPVSGALAAQLEAQGHELLEAGRYGEAVPVLTSAMAATGEHLQECLEPSGELCLTYAYALYDLGRALQLDGHSAAAVQVLQSRLQIDNQRPTVAVELKRAQAG